MTTLYQVFTTYRCYLVVNYLENKIPRLSHSSLSALKRPRYEQPSSPILQPLHSILFTHPQSTKQKSSGLTQFLHAMQSIGFMSS